MKQTIQEKVASIAAKLEGWNYIYDDYRTINQRLDAEELPAIVFTTPIAGTLIVGKSAYKDSAQCAIAFAAPCELDNDGVILDTEVIERCKRAAFAFVGLVNLSGLFEPLGDQSYEVFVNNYDANVAGVMITPTLTEIHGVSTCSTAEELTEW